MTARGRVHNGVVVLDNGVCLPEGQVVTVHAQDTTPTAYGSKAAPPHSVLDIPTISLGPILMEGPADGDLLGEMLEDRP